VVWGDADRRKVVRGKLAPVGNTVDVATATWTNTIGDPELATVWTDPDFDPAVRAFYYARVIEIPTRAGRRTTRCASGSRCRRGSDDSAGARLGLAHLVHARGIGSSR